MSTTTFVKGDFKVAGEGKEKDKKAGGCWISRLEFVQEAVDSQLESIKKTTPKKKV
jgi:hypothetical protein